MPQKPQKRQILVVGRNALEHFETLLEVICGRLRSHLLIHTDCDRAIGELNPAELRRSDAVVISHDREEGAWGSRKLLVVVSTLQAFEIGTIIVVGAYGLKLRKKLKEKAVLVREKGLGEMTEDGLANDLQQALGIEEQSAENTP